MACERDEALAARLLGRAVCMRTGLVAVLLVVAVAAPSFAYVYDGNLKDWEIKRGLGTPASQWGLVSNMDKDPNVWKSYTASLQVAKDDVLTPDPDYYYGGEWYDLEALYFDFKFIP